MSDYYNYYYRLYNKIKLFIIDSIYLSSYCLYFLYIYIVLFILFTLSYNLSIIIVNPYIDYINDIFDD